MKVTNDVPKFIGVILLIALVCFFITLKVDYNKNQVKKWADDNQYEIVDIKTHMTIFGTPYNYLYKGENIFEVKIETNQGQQEKWWIRTGVFSNDYEKEQIGK